MGPVKLCQKALGRFEGHGGFRIKAEIETSFFLAHYISEGSSVKVIFRRVTLKARKTAYQERLGLKLCTRAVRRTFCVKPGFLGRHWCELLQGLPEQG